MQEEHASGLLDMVGRKSLLEVVLGYWLGREASETEVKMLEEMMVLAIDHGPESPSAKATIAASGEGKDVLRGVEAGVHEINERHGGAIEGLGKVLVEDKREMAEIVKEYLGEGKRLPGYGHRIYKDVDPRSEYLLGRARDLGIAGEGVAKALEIEKELEAQKGQKLVLNIDGAMAAILTDIGVEPALMNAFFVWPRVAGLVYRWKVNRHGKGE